MATARWISRDGRLRTSVHSGRLTGYGSRIPVTILDRLSRAGKTTLLNCILTEQHGLRIAVIENEFGEYRHCTHELVIKTEEELFEMNNGCICCTVRGDLIRIDWQS